MDEKNDKIYIRINKNLCSQRESKYEGRPNYNIMRLPKGTVIGDTDLSYCTINPVVMIEDTKNPRMYCAIYDRNKLHDNSIQVYMKIDGEKKYMPVDADKLRDAVAAANHAYYEEHKKEAKAEENRAVEEKEAKVDKDRLQPLTPDRLKEQEEEREK